jgi:hypothetical protein
MRWEGEAPPFASSALLFVFFMVVVTFFMVKDVLGDLAHLTSARVRSLL